MPLDVVVIGLGAMGSAALYHLANRGLRVAGIERFEPGHDRGSSHGISRIIRLGYFEHPSYVPLVRSAIPLWRALEEKSGTGLLQVTGIIEIGAPNDALIKGTLRSAQAHALVHEVLDAKAVMRRFPSFRLSSDMIGVLQPEGGVLAAEPAVHAHLALAKAAGAEVRTRETVRAIEPATGSVRIVTDSAIITSAQVIVTAGPWVKSLLPHLSVPLRVTRQVVCWFAPSDTAMFARGHFPVFMLEQHAGIFYGFPTDQKGGVKFAKHHHNDESADPDAGARPACSADEDLLREVLAKHLPAANGKLLDAQTCLYTMAPDGDFIIDRLPGQPEIIVASPCSGHGFKFAPVIGEILADLATTGATRHDISRFRLARFN
jgi:sarcosine oxidase